MDLNRIMQIGTRAAYKAGDVLKHYLGKIESVTKKGSIDLVTVADTTAEKIIISTIRDVFPDHSILAEESGKHNGGNENRWIIDPLDGTTNFTHQFPTFCVSIGFASNGKMAAGIVFNPVNGELFTAIKGNGALLNNLPIQVSNTNQINDSLLATGFPYDVRTKVHSVMNRLSQCIMASRGIRRMGSAALDLCYVACGRLDGFWEEGLKPWDMAAGAIIVQEAGGMVTNYSGTVFDINQKDTAASNSHIHSQLLGLLKKEGA
ncbi:MAG: inositol monophosphatase [Desulfobacteraceae bacterium]|nr:inositol monophosphatase [Desulfobacteraceae bacterium]